MDENEAALFQRIREKCQRKHWYGPDMENPFEQQHLLQEADADSHDSYMTFYWYDRHGQQYRIDRDTDISNLPIMNTFEYSQATRKQIAITEQTLGFTLPPLLRDLYMHIANGGFGPGYGLSGIMDGFPATMVQSYLALRKSHRLVDIGTFEKHQPSTTLLKVPFYAHPFPLVELCHWGCAVYSYLDCATGRVFRGFALRDTYGFKHETASLFEWLDLWSQDLLTFE